MQFNTAHAVPQTVSYNSVQPCQRDTDDSSASRGKQWQRNRESHEFGREKEGKRGETGLKTKRKEGKVGGRGRELGMCNSLFHCCTNTKQDSITLKV